MSLHSCVDSSPPSSSTLSRITRRHRMFSWQVATISALNKIILFQLLVSKIAKNHILLIDKLLTKSEASKSSGDALASCLLNTCSENTSCERDWMITCRISSRSESLSSREVSPGTPCTQEKHNYRTCKVTALITNMHITHICIIQ
jgi:hypothetical protein